MRLLLASCPSQVEDSVGNPWERAPWEPEMQLEVEVLDKIIWELKAKQ